MEQWKHGHKQYSLINLDETGYKIAAHQSIKLWLVLGGNGVDILGDLNACILFQDYYLGK